MATLDELAITAGSCTRCPLAAGRTNVVFGEGAPDAGLMVVGEGPGRDEDIQGRPFVGRSGELLDRLLAEEVGVARAEVYIANVVKCRPPGNRDPEPEEVAACRPYLAEQVSLIAPRVLLTLGNFATRALLGTKQGIRGLRGRSYPYRGKEGEIGGDTREIRLVPTFHPAAALRSRNDTLPLMRADFVRAKRALAGVNDAAPA